MQPDVEPYAALPKDLGRVILNIGRSTGRTEYTAGYFTFLGGPAFGASALEATLKAFKWNRGAVYMQNDVDDMYLARAFSEKVMQWGFQIPLQIVEESSEDLSKLLATETNIFIFFGGHGCFNSLSKALVKQRPEVAIICCCTSVHSACVVSECKNAPAPAR